MPIECLRRDPQFFAERAYVSRLPMPAMVSRSFAAVIFGLRPPTRPRARAEARRGARALGDELALELSRRMRSRGSDIC